MRTLNKIVLVLLVALLALPLAGQEITGNIVGTVKDATGAVIPGASISILHTGKNVVIRTVTSDNSGEYVAPLLPIGNYEITTTATGFKQTVQGAVLNVNDKLTINFVLAVGGIEEKVTVEASELQVELQSPTASGLITGTQVRELSLNNRNYEQLVALQPGVSYGGGDQLYVGVMNPNGDDNSVAFSINGARDNANNWTIDGADNVDRGSNSTLLNYPSVDSIAEFKVLRGMYDAEFGRGAGGQVNVITKSGENTFHGSAYEFFRNDKLNANNYFNNQGGVPRPPLRYNNFGYTFSGPLFIPKIYNTEKNKTFFFFSQEFRRVIMSATSDPATLPTAAELQGNFANPVCVGSVDSAGVCSQTATSIPASSFSPAAQAYITDIFSKLPSATLDPLTGERIGVISPLGNIYNYRQEVIKVDHVFSPRLMVSGRWMNDSIPTQEPTGLWTGMTVPGVATTSTNAPGHNFLVRATATFSPTFLMELGYAYSYGAIVSRNIGLESTKRSPDVVNAITLPSPSTLGRIPALNFSGGDYFGGFGNYDDFNRNHNWFGNLTKIMGHHTLKFGATYHKYNKHENAGGNNTGTFDFNFAGLPSDNPSEFSQSWANFLLGRVSLFTQDQHDLVADIHQNQLELYAQDEFRIRPNLTLSYGLRYSLFRQPTDGSNRLTNFDPSRYDPTKAPVIDPATGNIVPGGNPNYDPLNGIIIGGHGSPYGTAVSSQNNLNFAPRFGIAWDPFGDGKTVVRTGYGMFFDSSTVGYVEDDAWVNPPFSYGVAIYDTVFTDPGSVSPTANTTPPYLRVAGTKWHVPYTQQWSLDVQHEFSKSFLVDLGYYGNKGTHLLGGVDINQVRPGVALAAGVLPSTGLTSDELGVLNALRPFVGYGYMNAVEPWFKSNYHSLQASVQKHFSNNSLFAVNYTWSRTMTDSPGDRWNAPQNTYNIAANYGPSTLDRRHMLTASYVYSLPWMKNQQGFVGHVLGGWEVSGIISYMGGTPLSVTSGNGLDHAGLGVLASDWNSLYPDVVSNPNSGAPHKLGQWFNTAAFQEVPDGVYQVGNEKRGVVRGPGFGRWDLSLFKNTKVSERVTVQFRAEAFNVWNHTNWSGVSTDMSSDYFGQVTSARDPRNIQFGLKLMF
jgi:Carboxypeptidase regulatory-like domain/TonB-dependent Receptor Plug Domain